MRRPDGVANFGATRAVAAAAPVAKKPLRVSFILAPVNFGPRRIAGVHVNSANQINRSPTHDPVGVLFRYGVFVLHFNVLHADAPCGYALPMTNDPRLTPLVASLPATVPFVGPEEQERQRGRPYVARLGANELGFGPSPRAIEAMRAAATEMWKYGDSGCHDLRQALADHHGIAPDHIIVGEGIDGLLGLLVRLVIAPGDAVVTSLGAYPTFNYHVSGFGGTLHTVPFRDDHEDPDALLAKAREVGAKLVYLCNPDNPMGTTLSPDRILALRDGLPKDALLILDEAYIECAPDGTAPDIAPEDERVIRFRTFSKGYGLAGLRIGYGIGPRDLIAAFDRVRNHFGINRMAQAAALAALRDQDHLQQTRANIVAARARIGQIARDNGLLPLPSATNFVTMDCGQDGAFARALVQALDARDVFVRMPFAAPQNRCIRVSCGPEDELSRFEAALPDALAELRANRG